MLNKAPLQKDFRKICDIKMDKRKTASEEPLLIIPFMEFNTYKKLHRSDEIFRQN